MKKKLAAIAVLGVAIAAMFGSTYAWFSDRAQADIAADYAGAIKLDVETSYVEPLIIWPRSVHDQAGGAAEASIEYRVLNKSYSPISGMVEVDAMGLYVMPKESTKELIIYDDNGSEVERIPAGTTLVTDQKVKISDTHEDYLLTDEGYKYGDYIAQDYIQYAEKLYNDELEEGDTALYKEYYERISAVVGADRFQLALNYVDFITSAIASSTDITTSYELNNSEYPLDPYELKSTGAKFYFGMTGNNPLLPTKEHSMSIFLKVHLLAGAGNEMSFAIIEPVSGVTATATQAKRDAFDAVYGKDVFDNNPAFLDRLIKLISDFDK